MNHNNVVSLPVGASALTAHQRVKLTSGLLVAAGADSIFIGHVLQDVAAGGTADVAYKWGSAFHYAIASGAIANGAGIGGAASGKIATGGTEGVALSAASGDGSIIRVIYAATS
jgi:hypothetical protein